MATDEIKNFGLSDDIPPGPNNSGTPDPFRVVILLSDGGEDAPPLYAATPPAVSQVSQDLTNQQIVVYTVGIGSSIDAHLLARIAREHGGDYQLPNLTGLSQSLYRIRQAAYNQTTVKSTSGTIAAWGGAHPASCGRASSTF